MKTIKFRGKNSKWEWVYGTYHYSCKYPDSHLSHVIGMFNEEVDPETVSQFIGLLDSNGVEIYERDVITDIFGNNHLIHYETESASFVALGNDDISCHINEYWIKKGNKKVVGFAIGDDHIEYN